MKTWTLGVMAMAMVLGLVGCAGSRPGGSCTSGMSVACSCAGGGMGTQVCGRDGTYSACECTTSDGGMPDGGRVCSPGAGLPCDCADGRPGAQVCAGDGSGYGSCTCGPAPSCGDGSCASTESCSSCASDCGACAPSCGDGTCASTESCSSCPSDCGACAPTCRDGVCDPGESCSTCEPDCGACPPTCGNGTCDPLESCSSCASDCGACGPVCGDSVCSSSSGESCSSCPGDCGACGCAINIDSSGFATDSCSASNICSCVVDPTCISSCNYCASPGTCSAVLPRRYRVSPDWVHLPTTNAGADWDFGGGAPDPYVVINTDGVFRARSSSVADSFDAVFTNGAANVSLLTGSTITLIVRDEDVASDDLAFSCTFTITTDLLRGRWIGCNDVSGGQVVVFVSPL